MSENAIPYQITIPENAGLKMRDQKILDRKIQDRTMRDQNADI